MGTDKVAVKANTAWATDIKMITVTSASGVSNLKSDGIVGLQKMANDGATSDLFVKKLKVAKVI